MHWSKVSFILLIIFYSSLVLGASPTLFCKCTCASNSSIISLEGTHDSSPEDPEAPLRRKTCTDCNRSLCLEYNLPICKDVKESEVSTTCFQRDSAKDQAVVYSFIAMTVGLLAYAAVKPCLENREQSVMERQNYDLVSTGQENE